MTDKAFIDVKGLFKGKNPSLARGWQKACARRPSGGLRLNRRDVGAREHWVENVAKPARRTSGKIGAERLEDYPRFSDASQSDALE